MDYEALKKYAEANPHIIDSLRLKWTAYIPHMPTPKQRAFLCLPHQEALFGGAAGGGKTDALLMAALQYVDIPGYSAIIFRKTLTDHRLPNSTMSRLSNWLMNMPVKFTAQENSFYFPTTNADGTPGIPSRVTFGYIGEGGVETRYQSAEFQFCSFDELTQHHEDHYLYLFSRLRRIKCPTHGKDMDDRCPSCTSLARVPIRMRSATNPGNWGHAWVKNRFNITSDPDPDNPGELRYIGKHPERPFIPSLAKDNPFLDRDEYVQSLANLPHVVREQLLKGDWSISHDARYKAHWFRRWSRYGAAWVLGDDGRGPTLNRNDFLRIFFTVDPASSSREGPGDVDNWNKRNPSYTVVGVFGLTPTYDLVLFHIARFRKEIPEVIEHVKHLYRVWKPTYITCEATGLGRGVYQFLAGLGLPMRAVYPHSDKVVRASQAMILAERGKIWLPNQNIGLPWLKDLEDELFVWTGHIHQTDDQVDVISMAGIDVAAEAVASGALPDETAPDGESSIYSESPFII